MRTTSLSLLDRVCRNEDADAWNELHEMYSPLIRGWLNRHGLSNADADDLNQEALLILMRKLSSFDHNGRVGAFRKWLRLIVYNCVRDHWKFNRLRQLPESNSSLNHLEQLQDESSPLSREWDLEHDKHVTHKLLSRIKQQVESKTWDVFELLTFEDKTPQEVADQLNISLGAVYTAKSRVLSKLRKAGEGLL